MWSSFPHESRVLAAAFWGSNAAILLKLPTLGPVSAISLSKGEAHLPRSVLLHTFGDTQPYLLAGLANGTLVAYELDNRTLEPKGKRVMSLGNLPLTLTPCRHGSEKPVVFVSGSRPAVLFLDNGRLHHSPIVLKAGCGIFACSSSHLIFAQQDVECAAMINSAKYPNSLVLAGHDGLVIGQLMELHKLHVRTVRDSEYCAISLAGSSMIRRYPWDSTIPTKYAMTQLTKHSAWVSFEMSQVI